MAEPEFGTEHADEHGVTGGMQPHEHLHGTGEGQHVHEGWVPDRVVERMQRDGFCGHAEQSPDRVVAGERTLPGMTSYCMNQAGICPDHDLTEVVPVADPPFMEVLALAHAVDVALEMLQVVAHQPVQGEAMHKVIGFHAHRALKQVGWLGPYGIIPGGMDNDPAENWKPIYLVVDPT